MKTVDFKTNLVIAAIAITAAFASCKKDDDKISQNVIDEVNKPEVYKEAPVWAERVETVPGSERKSEPVGHDDPDDPGNPPSSLLKASGVPCHAYNTIWTCVTKKYSASQNPDDFVMFNPLASVLWPGNLVQGESLASGIPTSIPVTKRQPGNIWLAIVTSGSNGAKMYRTVEKMQPSYVNQAMNDILSEFGGQGAARYNFEMNIVKSSAHLDFLLNASFAGWGASVRAGFSTSSSDNMTRVMVKLHQSYFTMAYDDPAGIDGVFTPDITVNDLRNYTGNGNPICYISSVTYGRMYYLLYESSATKDALTQALNASYNGFGVTATIQDSLKIKNTLENTTARVFQMGGGGAGGITAGMAVNLDAIRDFLEKGINFNAQNTGEPISYAVKYLKNAQIVRMNNAMEYELPDCVPETTPNVCDELPQLTTNAVETFTATTATLGGYITLEGTPPYSERGVCYATTPYPVLANNKTEIPGTGLGGFSTSVSGLTPNTTYYVRAYAINTEGTAYGEDGVSFKTLPTSLAITSQPVATTNLLVGNIAGSLSVIATVTGGATISYQWYSNTTNSNTGGTAISGETYESFTIPSGLAVGTYYYFCEVSTTGGATAIRSDVARVNVANLPVITINTQPAPTSSVTEGSITGSLTVSATVTGGATLSYQWYSNTTNSNTGGTAISGATSAIFPIPATLENGEYYYFCEVSATGGATFVRSDVARMDVSTHVRPNLAIDMASVQGGTFTMGAGVQSTTPQVTLSSFSIGKYAVTQAQWVAVMGSWPGTAPSSTNGIGDNYPAYNVSWNDIVGTSGAYMELHGTRYYADGFIFKLNQLTGKSYRLPTEAEWEFAARGGNQSKGYTYSGSNNIDDVAWYSGNNTPSGTKPVGTKAPNELGIYDMSGNVSEWCSDWYGSYTAAEKTNPTGPSTGSYRVHRGGSWSIGATYCSVANRISISGNPDGRGNSLGFRLALAL